MLDISPAEYIIGLKKEMAMMEILVKETHLPVYEQPLDFQHRFAMLKDMIFEWEFMNHKPVLIPCQWHTNTEKEVKESGEKFFVTGEKENQSTVTK